jgi:ribosomal protein S15P/S13E
VTHQMIETSKVDMPVEVSSTDEACIWALAEFIARGRGRIQKRIIQIEEPFRVQQQLWNLVRSIARVSGHLQIEPEDLELVRKVAFGTIDSQRESVMRLFWEQPGGIVLKDVMTVLEIDHNAANRLMTELEKLEMVTATKAAHGVGGPPKRYTVHPDLQAAM